MALVAARVHVLGDFKEFYATAVGVVTIVLLAGITLYYTSDTRNPVQSIAKASVGGPAMNIIFGFTRSFESTAFSVIVFTVAVVLAYLFSGVFGIAMVAVGFLSITATLIAMSAYGPIVDNAQGVIELSGAFKYAECDSLRGIDELDAVGNTTKAV